MAKKTKNGISKKSGKKTRTTATDKVELPAEELRTEQSGVSDAEEVSGNPDPKAGNAELSGSDEIIDFGGEDGSPDHAEGFSHTTSDGGEDRGSEESESGGHQEIPAGGYKGEPHGHASPQDQEEFEEKSHHGENSVREDLSETIENSIASSTSRDDDGSHSPAPENDAKLSKLPHREIPESRITRSDGRHYKNTSGTELFCTINRNLTVDEAKMFVAKKLGVGNPDGMMKRVNICPGDSTIDKLQYYLDKCLPATRPHHPGQG